MVVPGGPVLLLHKQINNQDINKERVPMRAPQQEVNKYLRWGLRWGLLRGVIAGSVKVVSDPPPADAMGSSSMTITAALALFAALWASVLKKKSPDWSKSDTRYKQQD